MHEASDGRDGVPADVSMRAVKLDFHCRTTSGARLFSTQARTASTSSLLACCLLMVRFNKLHWRSTLSGTEPVQVRRFGSASIEASALSRQSFEHVPIKCCILRNQEKLSFLMSFKFKPSQCRT